MIRYTLTVPNIKSELQPMINKSLYQSALVVRREAVSRAPYKSGNLRRSIVEYHNGNSMEVGTNVVYGAIHEYGGIIRPINGKYLTFKKGNKFIRVKQVTMPARPFIGPALYAKTQEIIKIFEDNFKSYI